MGGAGCRRGRGLPWWLSGKEIRLPTQEMQVRSLGQEDPLVKGEATHPSVLAWRIPWTEEPGGLQSMGLQRDGHDLVTKQQEPWLIWAMK